MRRLFPAMLPVVLFGMFMTPVSASASAAAPAPHWNIVAEAWPTYFKQGDKHDLYTVIATNDGSMPTNETFTVTITLPKGVKATEIVEATTNTVVASEFYGNSSCEAVTPTSVTVTCTFTGSGGRPAPELFPPAFVEIQVAVEVPETPVELVSGFATVAGGGAPSASAGDPTKISPAPVPFGLSGFSTQITGASGSPDTQAGSHPFEITTRLALNASSLGSSGVETDKPQSYTPPKDIEVSLPPGLVGNPNAIPKCSQALFQDGAYGDCPFDTQVGLVLLREDGASSNEAAPVYNVEPPLGQPAELGFGLSRIAHVPMFFHVRSDGDYGLTATLSDIPEIDVIQESTLSLWGVPADPAHNRQRRGLEPSGDECLSNCRSEAAPLRAFLTLPSSCSTAGAAPSFGLAADAWAAPGLLDADGSALGADGSVSSVPAGWVTAEAGLPAFTGCEQLSFAPSIAVAPETTQAASPSGYTVDLRVPQSSDPSVLATPDLKDAVVTLPAGTVLSPAAADGLEGCSEAQFGLHSTALASCPAAAQVGRLKITTPLLSMPMEGQVYVGDPSCSPCSAGDAQEGDAIRLFLQAQGSGVTVKLAGAVSVNQSNGQLTTTFENNPQLPFSELELTLQGGAHAPLVNAAVCGTATATADLRPWSSPGTPDATPSSSFAITGCPPTMPFAPSFSAGTVDPEAGAFSSFLTTVKREDGEQDLSAINVETPKGLLGDIASVPLCGEAEANAGTCSESSKIGALTVAAGAGSEPLWLPQAGRREDPVYLTGPYNGGPFGLSIVTHAEAGPFNLGDVVVRASIRINPKTAQVSVVSDPLPQSKDGIPLGLRVVNISINRPGFIFNPTDCDPLAVTGTLASTAGASASVASRFQAANCASLAFKPKLTASTRAHTSRLDGASLTVKVAMPPASSPSSPASSSPLAGEANIAKVELQLPKQLPSRLATLQKACAAAQFEANPAGCPAASVIGYAKALTPVLSVPLTGPAYLVSHGGAAFPDVEFVLQGEGVRIDLDGKTQIKGGITYSRFQSVPDAPVTSFETTLPEGEHAILGTDIPATAHGNLCKQKLTVPTTITAQNGAVVKQRTKLAVTGCAKPKRRRRPPAGSPGGR
jgi:hypothetical protein